MQFNKTIKYIFLVLFAIIAIFPFYWMCLTAFSETLWINDPYILPFPPYLGAIKDVLLGHPFLKWTLNTFIIAGAGTIGNLFVSSLAAFAFACLDFKGRDLLFYILLSTMVLPGFLTAIPRFFIVNSLGWTNTYWGVFIPTWFQIVSVFLLRQYFFSIPSDIINAARVDGANLWKIYWKIVMPIARPILFALFLITFLRNWNSFLWPIIILRTPKMQTLAVGMSSFYDIYAADYSKIMAGSVLSLVPILIMFIVFQKYIQQGLARRLKFQ